MANKGGRPSIYDVKVRPRFEEIEKWAESGETEKEIAKKLGIAPSTYFKIKNEHVEFSNLIKKSRRVPTEEIKAALYRKAIGFQYIETRKVTELVDGVMKVTKIEEFSRYAQPDVAASMVLLKHWEKDENGMPCWTNDPASLEIRKRELELMEKKIEENKWK